MLNAFVFCWVFAVAALFASIAFYVIGAQEVGNILSVASYIPATLWLAFASASIDPRKPHSFELVATLVFGVSAFALMVPEGWIGEDKLRVLSPVAALAGFASYGAIVTRLGFKIHSATDQEGSRFWSVAFVLLWLITALSLQGKVQDAARRAVPNSLD
jgi:hypothetical protein